MTYIYIYESLLFVSDTIDYFKSIDFLTNITFAFPWFIPITKSFLLECRLILFAINWVFKTQSAIL